MPIIINTTKRIIVNLLYIRFSFNLLFLYITNHNLPIMLNGNLISNDDLYKNFKTLYNKYTLISDYIPANSILTKLLNMVTTYIATGQINKKALLQDYIKLQNFQNICYDSIHKLAPFVENPAKVDLRNLSEGLQKNLSNLSKLISIHLENNKER